MEGSAPINPIRSPEISNKSKVPSKPLLSSTDKKVSNLSLGLFMSTLMPGLLMKFVGFSAEGVRSSLHQNVKVPAAFGLVNYTSIITGPMAFKAEFSYIKKVKACWGSVFGAISGLTSTIGGALMATSSAVGIATQKVSGAVLGKLNLAGSGFFCFAMFAMTMNSLSKIRMISNFKSDFKKSKDKNSFIQKVLLNPLKKGELERIIGAQEVEKLSSSKDFDTLKKVLDKAQINNAAFSFISLFVAISSLAVDVVTVGQASVICNVVNLAMNSLSALFSTAHSASSIQGSTQDKVVKYTLLALSTILTVGAFVATSVGSAGALPLALFIGSMAVPFVSLIYENTLGSKKLTEDKSILDKVEDKLIIDEDLKKRIADSGSDISRLAPPGDRNTLFKTVKALAVPAGNS